MGDCTKGIKTTTVLKDGQDVGVLAHQLIHDLLTDDECTLGHSWILAHHRRKPLLLEIVLELAGKLLAEFYFSLELAAQFLLGLKLYFLGFEKFFDDKWWRPFVSCMALKVVIVSGFVTL